MYVCIHTYYSTGRPRKKIGRRSLNPTFPIRICQFLWDFLYRVCTTHIPEASFGRVSDAGTTEIMVGLVRHGRLGDLRFCLREVLGGVDVVNCGKSGIRSDLAVGSGCKVGQEVALDLRRIFRAALQLRRAPMAQLLLDRLGRHLTAESEVGVDHSPLHLAAAANLDGVVRSLIVDWNASVDAVDQFARSYT